MPVADIITPIALAYQGQHLPKGGAGRVIAELARGRELDRLAFESAIAPESLESQSSHFRGFMLFAIARLLDDHKLTDDENAALRYLQRLFVVEEGTFYAHHREEVGAILAIELARLLEDHRIEAAEAVHQVDLQAVFGLGYDQYFELVRPHFYRVLLHLVEKIDPDKDRVVSEADLVWYHRQLAALDTVFNLNESQRAEGDEPGYLYVLVNPSMDGIVKVGKTTRSPVLRAKEIGSVTGVPTPFLLVFDCQVSNCSKAEQYVHKRLEALGCRVSDNREFFRIAPTEAIALVQEARVATVAA